MKFLPTIFIFLFGSINCTYGQDAKEIDNLKQLLTKTQEDTSRVEILFSLSEAYFFTKPDSCLLFASEALDLSRKLHYTKGEEYALNSTGEALRFLGDYPGALQKQYEALEINKRTKNSFGEGRTLGFIGLIYSEFREYEKALQYLYEAYKLTEKMSNKTMAIFDLTNIGYTYDMLKKPSSALYYQLLAYDRLNRTGVVPPLRSLILARLGDGFASLNKKDSALKYYRLSLGNAVATDDQVNKTKTQKKIAEFYEASNLLDSGLYYGRLAFATAKNSRQKLAILEASNLLVSLYRKTGKADSAFFYNDVAETTKDSLYGPERFKQLQLLMLHQQQQQQETERAQERYKNNSKMIMLWSAIGVFLIIALVFYRNNRQKRKANKILEDTLINLKATQSQLIQSEKMASLGELTAGIAHEIQNPLNFVNNFSDVNTELIDEMQQEMDKGNLADAKAISNDIKENEQKINHHGKRADIIVKGMLQHSRSSSGIKEPTDINKLADEYLRLAYHGLRAKDKSFNATMKTDFDKSIGKNISTFLYYQANRTRNWFRFIIKL